MKQDDQFERSALVAGTLAGLSFFPLWAILANLCHSTMLYGRDFDPLLTSILFSLVVFILSFPLTLIVDRKNRAGNLDKIDKIVVLCIIAWVLIWLGHVITSSGDICSKYDWRTYSVTLMLPTALAVLTIFARDWLRSDG